MVDYLLQFGPEVHFFAFILGSTRIGVFVALAPFMGGSVVTGTARAALVMALYLVLHPAMLAQVPSLKPLTGETMALCMGLLTKEVFLGAVLGWLSGQVFWAIESAGFFIDNQRGAGQATETDPLTGEQTSPTGSFLFQSATYVFFATGIFVSFLGILYSTYLFWPAGELLPATFFRNQAAALFFGKCLARLATNMVLISAPVVLACLFTDMALGLVNRFASQLNVYVLAMPIKCALSSFLLIFYFAVLMTDAPERFAWFGADIDTLKAFIGLGETP